MAVAGAFKFSRWYRRIESARKRNEFYRIRESIRNALDVADDITCDACRGQAIRQVMYMLYTLGDIRVSRHMLSDGASAVDVIAELTKNPHLCEPVM